MKDLYQSGDWKKEKHVPVVEILSADKEKGVTLKAGIGTEIAHPNTTAHHIAWIEIYFRPEGAKFPYQVARCDFSAHGASVDGADTSSVYSLPEAAVSFKTDVGGTIYAASYCNIHGLWEGSVELKL